MSYEDRQFLFDCPNCGLKDAWEMTKIGDPELRYHCGSCGYHWSVDDE